MNSNQEQFLALAKQSPEQFCPRKNAPFLRDMAPWLRWCLAPKIRGNIAAEYESKGQSSLAEPWRRRPSLPDSSGNCWVIFTDPTEFLADAFVLPLKWRPGPSDTKVPLALRELAEQVAVVLGDWLQEKGAEPTWGIQLDDGGGLNGLDLIWWGIKPASGWAALAAGLITAVRQGRPETSIWATGVWNAETGRWRVDSATLPHKLRLAADEGVQYLFVPSIQKNSAKVICEEEGLKLEIAELQDASPRDFESAPIASALWVALDLAVNLRKFQRQIRRAAKRTKGVGLPRAAARRIQLGRKSFIPWRTNIPK